MTVQKAEIIKIGLIIENAKGEIRISHTLLLIQN